VAFEEEKFHSVLADVHVSVKLKNPISSAKDWMKEKMSLQQSVLQTYEKKQFIVNVHQGRNLVNPNVSSEVVEPLIWFKF